MQRFLIFDYPLRYPAARRALAQWLRSGQLRYAQVSPEGSSGLPTPSQVFIGMRIKANA